MTDQNPYGQQSGKRPQQPYPTLQEPQPQKKPFYKRVWFIILAIIVLIIVIAGIATGGDDKKDTASSTTPTAPAAQPDTNSDDQAEAQDDSDSASNTMQLVLESDGAPINATWLQGGNTAQEQGVASGWTKDIPVDNKWDAIMNNVTGQLDGAGSLTCKILWNGEVITESTSSGDYAVVTCTPDMDKM